MMRGFDLDEEDLGLLRAEGIKRIDDFRRIKKVEQLQLPSVTREKVRELMSNLPRTGQEDGAMHKLRRSLGGLMDSMSGFLPSTPVKGAAANPTPTAKALKHKGEAFTDLGREAQLTTLV